jgi:hypothetical protein
VNKFAALIAPVLLTSFSAVAAPPEAKVSVEAVAPDKRIVTLDITQICGAKDTIRENLSNIGDTIIDTYTIMGRPCAAGETPQRQHVEIPVDLADTARILMGVKSQNPEFKVVTKFELR